MSSKELSPGSLFLMHVPQRELRLLICVSDISDVLRDGADDHHVWFRLKINLDGIAELVQGRSRWALTSDDVTVLYLDSE